MELTQTQAVIKRFKDYVIQQAKSNLTKGGKNVTKGLYNSIKGEIVNEGNYTIVGFIMDEYGAYQDQGVKGKTSSAKAPNSPFRFGTGSGKSGGMREGIGKWVQRKKIQFRDKDSGKFLSYKSTSYIISRSIYNKGLKPSLFFTKPFEKGYARFVGSDLMVAFSQDVDTIIDYNLKTQ